MKHRLQNSKSNFTEEERLRMQELFERNKQAVNWLEATVHTGAGKTQNERID